MGQFFYRFILLPKLFSGLIIGSQVLAGPTQNFNQTRAACLAEVLGSDFFGDNIRRARSRASEHIYESNVEALEILDRLLDDRRWKNLPLNEDEFIGFIDSIPVGIALLRELEDKTVTYAWLSWQLERAGILEKLPALKDKEYIGSHQGTGHHRWELTEKESLDLILIFKAIDLLELNFNALDDLDEDLVISKLKDLNSTLRQIIFRSLPRLRFPGIDHLFGSGGLSLSALRRRKELLFEAATRRIDQKISEAFERKNPLN